MRAKDVNKMSSLQFCTAKYLLVFSHPLSVTVYRPFSSFVFILYIFLSFFCIQYHSFIRHHWGCTTIWRDSTCPFCCCSAKCTLRMVGRGSHPLYLAAGRRSNNSVVHLPFLSALFFLLLLHISVFTLFKQAFFSIYIFHSSYNYSLPIINQYSTLLHLPPLRFRCVGGCWDRIQGCRDFGIGIQTP
jgi:hypothetical protein